MESLNKTETPIFLSVVCFFVSKGNLFDVYLILQERSVELNNSTAGARFSGSVIFLPSKHTKEYIYMYNTVIYCKLFYQSARKI